MSSHREAPEISKDPAADNTDVYAYVDATDPTKVNLIANFNPFQIPYGGPNFNEFADDVLYTINVSNQGQSQADISYQFRFTTKIVNPKSFLYNTGPITKITDTTWNRPQTFSVTKVVRASDGKTTSTILGTNKLVPPCNVGVSSTPHYAARFQKDATQSLGTGRMVFAGQRSDPFYVDLGSVFDLGTLRPFQKFHAYNKQDAAAGINGLQGLNVHTIALQVPIAELSKNGLPPTDIRSPNSCIGVWSSTFRTRGRLFDSTTNTYKGFGNNVQVSRLGNPLVNEVLNPMGVKDKWNGQPPSGDSAFASYVDHPELAALLPALYPGVFPNLAKYTKPRADLDAILLTGIPAAVFAAQKPPVTFSTYTGSVKADMLRLNLAIKPTAPANESQYGVLGNDLAGFPNGRRLNDNVTAIELRAIAGATIPLVDSTYTADDNAGKLTDGTTNTNIALLKVFPYVGTPASGYDSKPGTPVAPA